MRLLRQRWAAMTRLNRAALMASGLLMATSIATCLTEVAAPFEAGALLIFIPVLVISLVCNVREVRAMTKESRTLADEAHVLQHFTDVEVGLTNINDLPPAMQEEIKIKRATYRLNSEH